MTEQPKNDIEIHDEDGLVWVDVTCGAYHGGMCGVGLASGRSKGAALRRAAKRLREIANRCEELSKANAKRLASADENLNQHEK